MMYKCFIYMYAHHSLYFKRGGVTLIHGTVSTVAILFHSLFASLIVSVTGSFYLDIQQIGRGKYFGSLERYRPMFILPWSPRIQTLGSVLVPGNFTGRHATCNTDMLSF